MYLEIIALVCFENCPVFRFFDKDMHVEDHFISSSSHRPHSRARILAEGRGRRDEEAASASSLRIKNIQIYPFRNAPRSSMSKPSTWKIWVRSRGCPDGRTVAALNIQNLHPDLPCRGGCPAETAETGTSRRGRRGPLLRQLRPPIPRADAGRKREKKTERVCGVSITVRVCGVVGVKKGRVETGLVRRGGGWGPPFRRTSW